MTMAVSTAPPPKPPRVSSNGRPSRPISVICAHIASLWPPGSRQVFLALLEAVLISDETIDAVLQQALVVGEIEIHVYSPRIALAMILR